MIVFAVVITAMVIAFLAVASAILYYALSAWKKEPDSEEHRDLDQLTEENPVCVELSCGNQRALIPVNSEYDLDMESSESVKTALPAAESEEISYKLPPPTYNVASEPGEWPSPTQTEDVHCSSMCTTDNLDSSVEVIYELKLEEQQEDFSDHSSTSTESSSSSSYSSISGSGSGEGDGEVKKKRSRSNSRGERSHPSSSRKRISRRGRAGGDIPNPPMPQCSGPADR